MPEPILIDCTVNGERRRFSSPPGRRLLDLIRDEAGLTGTKEGCGAGECGACTVLLDGKPVPSCMVLAASAEGHEITTVEGLVTRKGAHPVQEALVSSGGVQCGFCTPGIVMTSVALLESGVDDAERRRRLAGNLCRCTGYTKIFQALKDAQKSDVRHD